MKNLTAGLILAFFFASAANAQTWKPIETAGPVEGETVTINKPLSQEATNMMIAGGASINDTATNNTLNISTDISETDTTVPEGQYNHYIAGGAVYNNTADSNTVNITNANISGRAVAGGLARTNRADAVDAEKWNTGHATNNTVNITGATINVNPQTDSSVFDMRGNPVAVAGGATQFFVGNAAGNTVNITNSTVTGGVVGGLSYVKTTQEEVDNHPDITAARDNSYNSVNLKGSTINGDVYGSFGGVSGNYNTVVVDNTTVNGNVFAAQSGFTLYDGDQASGTFDYNRLDLINGSSVQSAAAVSAANNNASYNVMNLSKSSVTDGTIYTVKMIHGQEDNSATIGGTTDYNTLNITETPMTAYEIGGALNFTGSPSHNTVNISKSNITLNYNSNEVLGGVMDIGSLTGKELLGTKTALGNQISPKLNTSHGYILGGATADYTSKTNAAPTEEEPEEVIAGFGTAADNNTIALKDGTINANVVGGMASYVREIDYTTQQTDEEGRVTEKKEVHKKGLTITTTTTTYTYDEETGGVTTKTETASEQVERVDDQLSASGNTIMLTNVTLNGDVYGSYVDGAELKQENMLSKNNTVVLAGNTKINGTVYGGSNSFYAHTNNLVFSHIADGNNFVSYDMNNFKNFNPLVSIYGDFDTRLEITGGDIHANLTLGSAAMKEDSQQIIRTPGEILDGYGPVECNGDPNCIKYTSDVALTNNKLGAYSFTLTPELNGDVLEWTLTSHKDKANVEIYGQLPLVGLALISEGPEMLNQTMNDIWQSETEQNTFVNGGYHHTRYKTGSGFDLDSSVVHAGAWKKFTNDWVLGFYGKYAGGSYDTFPIKVSGSANAFGGGLITSLRYSETGRLELSAEAGYMDMDFDSSELLSSFNSKGLYYGASAGFVENLLQDLDLFANIQWIRKEKDDITDNLDQKIAFDAMQSLALRFGADYVLSSLDLGGLTPAFGVSGIYEMDGESTVTVDGMKNSDASLKGMSGRGDLSLIYHNRDSFLPLHTVLTVYGQVGKREGFGGEINISFEF